MGPVLFAALLTMASAGAPEPTLTRHVPEDVARGTAARVGVPAPAQIMELSISLPLRNEAEGPARGSVGAWFLHPDN